jgi:hypothetical protein
VKTLEEKREYRATYMVGWRKKNPIKSQQISIAGNKKWRKEHHEDYLASKRRHYDRIRMFVWEWFGNMCIKCGFSDYRAFELDHINSDGYKERTKYQTMDAKYKLIMTNPDLARKKFQLLCANCNRIEQFKRKEYGRLRGRYD